MKDNTDDMNLLQFSFTDSDEVVQAILQSKNWSKMLLDVDWGNEGVSCPLWLNSKLILTIVSDGAQQLVLINLRIEQSPQDNV